MQVYHLLIMIMCIPHGRAWMTREDSDARRCEGEPAVHDWYAAIVDVTAVQVIYLPTSHIIINYESGSATALKLALVRA